MASSHPRAAAADPGTDGGADRLVRRIVPGAENLQRHAHGSPCPPRPARRCVPATNSPAVRVRRPRMRPVPTAASPVPKRRRGGRMLLAAASIALAGLLGEGVLRIAGGFHLFELRLRQPPVGNPDVATQFAAMRDLVDPVIAHWRTLRPDLDPGWLATSPPPLPRHPDSGAPLLPQQDWLLHYY